MPSSEQRLIRRGAVAFAALYPVAMVMLAALKATTPLFGAMPWPEVAYGPAITLSCSFSLFSAAVKVECWVRDRA